MNSAYANSESHLSEQTILPNLPELFTDERNGNYLILNPLGPWWFIGSKLHTDFLALCNGKRTIKDIFELLRPDYQSIKLKELIRLADSLSRIKFFTRAEPQPVNSCSVVHFYVTRRCNLECPFCFYDSTPAKSKFPNEELKTEVWLTLAGEIAAINPKAAISISGGEPLLRPDIIDIIEGISQFNLQIRLITNGTLFTGELINHLAKIPKFNVQVSIDSLVPEENAQTRGQGSLEKAIQAVHQLMDTGITVGITSTVTRINKDSVWRTKQFCEQHRLNFGTSYFFKSGSRSQSNADWLELSIDEIVESAVCNSINFNGKGTTSSLTPGQARSHCGIGCGQLAVQPDGFISPCRLLLDPHFYLGNIMKSRLSQLLVVGRRKYAFIGVDRVSCGCAICPVRYFCVGGCKANSYYNYGSLDRLPPNCGLLKKIYLESLWASIEGVSARSQNPCSEDNSGSAIPNPALYPKIEEIPN